MCGGEGNYGRAGERESLRDCRVSNGVRCGVYATACAYAVRECVCSERDSVGGCMRAIAGQLWYVRWHATTCAYENATAVRVMACAEVCAAANATACVYLSVTAASAIALAAACAASNATTCASESATAALAKAAAVWAAINAPACW